MGHCKRYVGLDGTVDEHELKQEDKSAYLIIGPLHSCTICGDNNIGASTVRSQLMHSNITVQLKRSCPPVGASRSASKSYPQHLDSQTHPAHADHDHPTTPSPL